MTTIDINTLGTTYLLVQQVADRAGIPYMNMLSLIRTGKGPKPAGLQGLRKIFAVPDVDAWIESRKQAAA